MKKVVLLLIVTSILVLASKPIDVTLVGLSGKGRTFQGVLDSDSTVKVNPLKIWDMLYLNKAVRGDTLVCEFGGRYLYIIESEKFAQIDSSKFPLHEPLETKKKDNVLAINDFTILMTELCQDLEFTYNSDKISIVVSKGLPKQEFASSRPLPLPKNKSKNAPTKLDEKSKVIGDTSLTSKSILQIESVDISQDDVYKRLTWQELRGIVVIDPGHGGKDPGAIGPSGVQEKDVVLAIAKHSKKFIERNSKVTLLLTRNDDTFIPLRGRTKFANSKEASLFVSVHANATEDGRARGFKMYFLSEAKNESDQRTAMLENAVMELEEEVETDALHSILLDMMSSEFLFESQGLSIQLAETFAKRLETKQLHTGVGQANFYVLRGASMPAVLVEAAFISNAKEEKVLADKKYQRQAGDAIGRAILDYLQDMGKLHE